MFNINVLGVCTCMQEAVTLMRASGVADGHIINLGSVVAYKVGDKPMYAGSKFAVRALTEGLRIELQEVGSHIRATMISPGLVSTQFALRYLNHSNASCTLG